MSTISISQNIKASPSQVFESYLNPKDNQRWQNAGGGWSTGFVNIDAQNGGRFEAEFKAADGVNDFVFGGTFDQIIPNQKINYTMDDGRKSEVLFEEISPNQTKVSINFEAENQNSAELQQQGWNQILVNFKTFVERKVNPKNAILVKNIEIKTSKEKVWETLLDQQSYQKWTAIFCEGSYYEGEMKLNNKIWFLSPGKSGLSSLVKVLIPGFQVSFEHLGAVKNGVEDFESPEFLGWKGARETYTLTEKNGITNLEIYQDLTKTELEMFDKMWDKSLQKIKELSEN
jgi:uncharacterized protein YndB with AHSA1/START domain